jgi:hypothetical protein
MNVKAREQAETKVAAMAAKLSDEALCLAWMATEGKPVTQELAIARGWIQSELHVRLGDDLFDEWLVDVDDKGNGVNPLAYFERKAATKGYIGCWDCTQPATHIMTRAHRIALYACDRHARADRATAEASSWTLTPLSQIPAGNHAHRVYFTQNGTTDPGTVTETARLLPNGDPSPKGDLYVRVAFDDGMTDWCHHSLLTSV